MFDERDWPRNFYAGFAKRLGRFLIFVGCSSRLSNVTSFEYVRRNLALLDASSP